MAEIVYAAEWPGFPGETSRRRQARDDIEAMERTFQEPVDPDWLTMTEVFKAEEATVAKEHALPAIYDYEVEMCKPIAPISQRVSWHQRVKSFMGKANNALRDASISALATTQAKLHEYYTDEEAGAQRKKISTAVAGAIAVGATAYISSKGLMSSGSSHRSAVEATVNAKAALAKHLGSARFQHAAGVEPHYAIRAAMKVQDQDNFVTVHNDQNPWDISRRHLMAAGNPHPTRAQIDAYDHALAHDNPDIYQYGGDSSQYISAGTRLRLP